MINPDSRIAQLEEEVRILKAQLKQAQEYNIGMLKNESTFRSIFDYSSDGIALVDNNGIIREWSRGYEQISGLPKKLVVGKIHLWEMCELLFPYENRSEDECERMKAELKELVATMQHKTHVRHVRHCQTGELRIFNILYFPVAVPSGEMMFCSISRDITGEVRSRELLEENERKLIAEKKRLETLSDNLPEGTLYRLVIERDTGRKYMEYVSGTWERVTGLTPESVTQSLSSFDEIVHSEDRLSMNYSNELAETDLSSYHIELRINRNNAHRWLRIASFPYVDGNKVIWDGIMTDVTDRKEAEFALIHAKEKAEESDKLKSAFLANLSHEIRTPLNGITGFLHFLSSGHHSPALRQEYFNVINNSITQLVKLIDDIVDVAKIEAKQLHIRPEPLYINSLMKEVQVFFETYLQSSNKEQIELILDDSEFINNCFALIDPLRLRQVLNNLIGNAIKFTEKGYIRFGYRQTAPDQLEFVVEDTGIGINPDLHNVIFERFRQAEHNSRRLYGGTGLGLNIAQNLVQLMGGEIRVESAESAGAAFYFTISYLPVVKEN